MSEFEELDADEEVVAFETDMMTMATIQAEIREMFIAFHKDGVFDFKRLEEIAKYGKKNL